MVREHAIGCIGACVGRQRERKTLSFGGGAPCSTIRVGVTIPAIGMMARAISAVGHVQFPDVRIEYDVDGRDRTLDVEVMTPNYRGAHAAAKSGSSFALYFSNRGRGGGGRTPSVIEVLLR
jgi:hypothetical protein